MIITAKFASVCPCCSKSILVGTKVEWSKGEKARHLGCKGAAAVVSVPRYSAGYSRRGSGAGYAAPVAGYSKWCTDRDSCGCYDCAS